MKIEISLISISVFLSCEEGSINWWKGQRSTALQYDVIFHVRKGPTFSSYTSLSIPQCSPSSMTLFTLQNSPLSFLSYRATGKLDNHRSETRPGSLLAPCTAVHPHTLPRLAMITIPQQRCPSRCFPSPS